MSSSSHTVTLVTGDVVRLGSDENGRQHASVVRHADPRVGIHTFTSGGDVYVEPASVSGLLASGRLDEQLFNVSRLVEQGYGDGDSHALPLIVSYADSPGAKRALTRTPAPEGARKRDVLESVHALAVTEGKKHAEQFWADVTDRGPTKGNAALVAPRRQFAGRISHVWLDAQLHATLDESVPQIGAPAAWARGLTGAGLDVAVLDTGIDPTHPDFAGRIDQTHDFTGKGSVIDGAGHGTHVASIVAGSGAASNGRYRGVAPDAHLMIGKVLDDQGQGRESWAIAGMEWATDHDADVVNLSLGGAVTKGDDPLAQALDALSEQHDTLFVAAAGNGSVYAPGSMEVTTPGSAAAALTVGAVDKSDRVWHGSRNGLMGDADIKPDLLAPGVSITAARAAGTGFGGGAYTTMTGTSMAAPHVTGSVALLEEQHPQWGVDRLKAALTSTAAQLQPSDVFKVGAGRVDVGRATAQHVYVNSGLIDFGYFARPYDPAKLHPTRTLTYTNSTDETVTLQLSATLTNERGEPAPAGVMGVAPQTLTIAPGETSDATIAVDVASAPAQTYSGDVVATGSDGLRLDTAVGFYKQDDTVDVTFRARDRRGRPATARLRIAPYKEGDPRYYPENIYLTPQQQEWTLRLPEGDYNVFSLISTFDKSGRWVTQDSIVGDPKLEVHAPNFTVTLDARTAEPVTVETPKQSTPHYFSLDWARGDPANPLATYDSWQWNQTDGGPTQLFVAPTERVDDAPFSVTTSWDSGAPILRATVGGPKGAQPVDAVFTGGPFVSGRHHYPIVDAGTASPGDLQGVDLRGKAALVEESGEMSYDAQVQAAAQAGAAVVALYSDRAGAFYPRAWGSVPIIALPHDQGARLVALAGSQHPVQLHLRGVPRSPYAYDLTFAERQQVSTSLHYQVAPGDLARVRTRIYTTGTHERGWRMHRGKLADCECSAPVVSDYQPSTGYTRTEYVNAEPGITTFGSWQFRHGLPANVVYPQHGHVYKPGRTYTQEWLKAPLSPGVANTSVTPSGREMLSTRRGNWLHYDIAGLTDAAGHWSVQMSGTKAASRLYLGDELLTSSDYLLRGGAQVPPKQNTYRLEVDTKHDGTVIGLSTFTHTEWTFHSRDAGSHRSILPLIDVDYDDVTNPHSGRSALTLGNTAPLGRRVALHLTATHQQGSKAPPISQLTVSVSFDHGHTWSPAQVEPTGDEKFTATYRHPRHGNDVSLRVTASDPAGNKLRQTLIRAYRLGDRRTWPSH